MTYTIDRETLGNHVEGVRRLARSLVRSDAEADDVVQDTMLVALQSRTKRRAGAKAWLAGVTRNVARRMARTSGRRRKHERAAARPEAIPATDEVVIRAAEQSRLLDLVVTLNEPYRTAILLRFVDGLPPRDIAARRGIPVETARTHIKRGLQMLREQLDDAHGGDKTKWRAALAVAASGPTLGTSPTSQLPLLAMAAVLAITFGALWLLFFDGPGTTNGDGGASLLTSDVPNPERDASPRDTSSRGDEQREPEQPAGGGRNASASNPEETDVRLPAASPDKRLPPAVVVPRERPVSSRIDVLAYTDNGYAVLDPAHSAPQRMNDERLVLALYEGLTILDPKTGKAVPGTAEAWEVSEDGRTWTFDLRKTARWSDGSRVTARDFVRAWKRLMDPFTQSEWSGLFRPIAGCATITDNSVRTEAFANLRNYLKNLVAANPNGIPGDALMLALEDTGVRPFLTSIKSRSVQKMLVWKVDALFPPEMAARVIGELRKARKKVKDLWVDAFERFGRRGTGVHALDEHTLVVRTTWDVPYLPSLLARGAFAPLHRSVEDHRDKAFEPGTLVGNGPFVLKGRGARPPENTDRRVLSVVELEKNQRYGGPRPAVFRTVRCFTDQGWREDLRRFEEGEVDWVGATWPECVPKRPRARKPRRGEAAPPPRKPRRGREDIEAASGYAVRPQPETLYLLFRCDRAPFRDLAARRAFALSIDRETLAKRTWPSASPAHRLVPHGIARRTNWPSAAARNVDHAKSAKRRAGLDSERWIEMSFGEQPGHDEIARALKLAWKKDLGIEPGERIESNDDVRKVLRSGNFYTMLKPSVAAANDAMTFLEGLDPRDPDSGHAWRDAAFMALLDGARDLDAVLAAPSAWVKRVGLPDLEAVVNAAQASDRPRLRRALLAAAEQRLLDQYVMVPLLQLSRAELARQGRTLGSDAAWATPGFVGWLRSPVK